LGKKKSKRILEGKKIIRKPQAGQAPNMGERYNTERLIARRKQRLT